MKNLTALFVAALFISVTAFAQNTATTTTTTTTKTEHSGDKEWKDGCKMKDGKVWCKMDGKKMEVTKEVTLDNGVTVMADGTVKTKDGKTTKMKNGECVDMKGNVKPYQEHKKDGKTGM